MIKAHNIYKSKKLIKISLEYTDNKKIISSIRITGDFFLYPEETLDQIEASLIGKKMDGNGRGRRPLCFNIRPEKYLEPKV